MTGKPTDKPVQACLCYPHTFAELKAQAEQRQWRQVEDITEEVGCGGGCGLCRPYLARMLRTGETAFAVFDSDESVSERMDFLPKSSRAMK